MKKASQPQRIWRVKKKRGNIEENREFSQRKTGVMPPSLQTIQIYMV